MNLRTLLLVADLQFARFGIADPSNTVSLSSVTTTSGSAVLTCTSTTGVKVGAQITGTDIPSNTTVLSINSSTSLTLSANASGSETSGSATVTNVASYSYQPTAPAGSTPGSTAYTELGRCPNLTIAPQGTEVKIESPFASSGVYAHRKTLMQVTGATFSGNIQDFSPYAFESIFRLAGPNTIGTAQQPFLQAAPITGWLALNAWDNFGNSTLAGAMAVEWSVSTYEIAKGKYGFAFKGDVIFNPLNTINLAALASDAY